MCLCFIMYSLKVFLISNYSSEPIMSLFAIHNSQFKVLILLLLLILWFLSSRFIVGSNYNQHKFPFFQFIGGIPPRSKWKSQNQNVWRCFIKSSVDTYCPSLCYVESSVHTWSEGLEKRNSSKDCLGKLSF